MNTYEIVPLPKEEWKGTPVPMRYTTEGYFDVEIREDADSFHVDMVKKLFDEPVLHEPDFADGLYEGAGSTGGEKAAPKKKLLACIECCPEEWSNRLLVTEVWVADELHRQGIATRMMNLVKEKAMRDGRRAIMLETQSCNLHAIAFYRSQGFQLLGIDSCCYGNFDIARHEVRINLVYYIRPDVVRAGKEDLKEILDLQYLAYQSEAALFGNKDIPPFVKAARYPIQYCGVNSLGLQRRGFSQESINRISDIYRLIFVKGLAFSEAVEQVKEKYGNTDEGKQVLAFIGNANTGLMSGYKSVRKSE